ncbi:ABC transporter ATP-binding protein [Exiguobacterium sp. s102]|uniref:ABC transporter ATP-binding protein n=1 Tax=Exiguobacterium sp. s102 TaxID=2751212 RepID=UPI001BE5D124|nr:ABC transporter ATP-binding protein [Exiguobacterium sp. s102]
MDISVNHLSHAFQLAGSPSLVLNDLTCQFSATEVTAIVGASGSGKSTFLSMIGSLDRPTSGQIEYDGQDISRWKNRRLSAFRAQEIGFVFQQFHLLPALTVKENVLVPLLKQKTDFNKEERIAQILEKVGLLEKQHALPAQLSGGQQQRVAIARALISRPRWILADEPTGNLDSVTGETIFQLLLDLHREEQCGILFVTHDVALAERADRILFMQDGQIIEDRRKKTIQSG